MRYAHQRWLTNQKFEHAAQQLSFQEGVDAIEDAVQRLRHLEKQFALIVPRAASLQLAPVRCYTKRSVSEKHFAI